MSQLSWSIDLKASLRPLRAMIESAVIEFRPEGKPKAFEGHD